jgi:hypothetical protein
MVVLRVVYSMFGTIHRVGKCFIISASDWYSTTTAICARSAGYERTVSQSEFTGFGKPIYESTAMSRDMYSG